MARRTLMSAVSAGLSLVAAILSLGAYRAAFGAIGVVLDTRPTGLALAGVSMLLAVPGLRSGRPASLFPRRRVMALVAFFAAAFATGLLVRDLFLAYRAQDVRFSNGEVTLAGTLYLPRGGASPYPAVVITHGAGEETRKEGAFYARLFARSGIAALAYDKRGSGESGGDLAAATYQDLAADALAAVHHLAGRSEIAGSRIGLWGVSEGAWVVPIVAATENVAFVIVVSATAETPAEQVRYEVGERVRRAGYGADLATRATDLYARVSEFERTGQGHDGLAADLGRAAGEGWFRAADYLPEKLPTFEELKQRRWYPAWRTKMDFDAREFWRRVRCPVLVLLGGRDPKMSSARAESTIRGALLEGANADVTVQVFPRAEHGVVEWWLPGRIPPPRFPDGYTALVANWAVARVSGPGSGH